MTVQPAVIPTGATNGVRSGMEESLENIDLSIQLDFLDRIDRIFRMKMSIIHSKTLHQS